MRHVMALTNNVRRFINAAKALEQRLDDQEVMGMGLVYGRPGLGKSMAAAHYHARSMQDGRIRTVAVRALAIWTESSMLKDLLRAIGQSPHTYRKDVMFDQLVDSLSAEPALFLIDEVDAIAESRRLVNLLKDIHDLTGSAVLMIGEQRVDAVLQRYEAFYNRINRSALINVRSHSAEDVAAVITQRCEVTVDPAVCRAIQEKNGKSMRAVVDAIREMERFAQTNQVTKIGLPEYRQMIRGKPIRVRTTPIDAAVEGSAYA